MRALIIIGFLTLVFSSTVAQEKQVPFFPEGNVIIIDKTYAKKASLFTNYENFIEARLFEISNNEYAVEIYYEKNGQIYKDRKVLNELQKNGYISSLKREVVKETPSLAKRIDTSEVKILDQTGRPLLLVNSTIVGLAFYGYAVPLTLRTEKDKLVVALYMLSSGASFLIPYSSTKDKQVTFAQTSLTLYGQTRGILHGMLLSHALIKKVNSDDYGNNWDAYYEDDEKRMSKLFGFGITTSVAGGIAGYKLAEKWDYTPGDASIFQMWGDVGALEGLLMSNILGFIEEGNGDNIIYTVFLSSAAGMVVGKQFGDSKNYTVGDAIVYRTSIGLGAVIPPLLLYYFEPDDQYGKLYTSAAMAGSIGGAYLGWKLLKDIDFSTGQGLIISFSSITGTLFGLGLGYLVSPEDTNAKFLLTTGALGGMAGYALTYRQFKKKAYNPKSKLDIDMSFNPASLVMKEFMPKTNNPFLYNEMINFRLRF